MQETCLQECNTTLAGTAERASLDLNTLREEGVRIAGRLMAIRDGKAQFSGSLRNVCALADLKMTRLLDHFDDWACRSDHATGIEAAQRFAPTSIDASPLLSLDLPGRIRTVVWAAGMQPDHRWLDLPVFDCHGEVRHRGGVVDGVEGLYVLGLPFLRRRKSSFIHGAGDDVRDLVAHLHAHLDRSARLPPAERRAAARPHLAPAAETAASCPN